MQKKLEHMDGSNPIQSNPILAYMQIEEEKLKRNKQKQVARAS